MGRLRPIPGVMNQIPAQVVLGANVRHPTAEGLEELGRRNLISLLVEGGGELHAAFFAEGLVDKVYAYVAPMVIGGREAIGPVGGSGVDHLKDAIGLSDLDFARLGDDLLISGYVHRDS